MSQPEPTGRANLSGPAPRAWKPAWPWGDLSKALLTVSTLYNAAKSGAISAAFGARGLKPDHQAIFVEFFDRSVELKICDREFCA